MEGAALDLTRVCTARLELCRDPCVNQSSSCVIQLRFHPGEVIDSLWLAVEHVTRTDCQVDTAAEQLQTRIVVSYVCYG